jgi:hypothetical protein
MLDRRCSWRTVGAHVGQLGSRWMVAAHGGLFGLMEDNRGSWGTFGVPEGLLSARRKVGLMEKSCEPCIAVRAQGGQLGLIESNWG